MPREASFLSKLALPPWQSAHGLCTLRRVTTALARGDSSATVVVLMYKGVNKAAPSKGAPRIATLVIREPSAATLQRRRHRGTHPASAAPAHRPVWTVAFPALVTPPPAVDRVHGLCLYGGLYLYCAPLLLLRRHVVALPAKMFWGKRPETPIKGGGARSGKGLVPRFTSPNPRSEVSSSHC